MLNIVQLRYENKQLYLIIERQEAISCGRGSQSDLFGSQEKITNNILGNIVSTIGKNINLR
jgi:hypothetical protein